MAKDSKLETVDGFFNKLSPEKKEETRAWLEQESDRADARADAWLEKGLRLVLILNAGGVLALLTAAGALLSEKRSLDPLLPAANVFLIGLAVAAVGTLVAAWFFNYFSKRTHDLHRRTVSNELTAEENKKQDKSMSKWHTTFQWFTLILTTVAFLTFGGGAMIGLNAVQAVTTPTTPKVTPTKPSTAQQVAPAKKK